MVFSIIVVALNPGAKLQDTLDSISAQTFGDYEVILKDGGSTDGSMDPWRESGQGERGSGAFEGREEFFGKVRYVNRKDSGIYDAMNQAAALAGGRFILFLNCGDLFADGKVLERTASVIEKQEAAGENPDRMVLYGDTMSEKNGVVIASAPVITGLTCYRNIPCHQSCFYAASLCREKPYDLQYKIRADYDHFLWCFYRGGAKMLHMDFPVSSYEGGGFSEKKANRKRDREEHRQITSSYMSRRELFRYRAFMALTLAPLRRAMAESGVLSGVYHAVKEWSYCSWGVFRKRF